MTTITCDKCGVKISTNPLKFNTNPPANTILPTFSIRRMDDLTIGWEPVDLCPECEKILAEWLNDNSTIPDTN